MMRKSDLDAIRDLAQGNSVGGSRLQGKLLARLLQEHLVVAAVHGSRVSYRAISTQSVASAFEKELATEHLSEASRAELVALTGDSKTVRIRSCPGFPVNTYEPLPATLDGRNIVIAPEEGSFTFICDWETFSIAPNVVVVGVENMENFRMVRSQRYLFDYLCASVLFVSRYPQSKDLVEWLKGIPNRYLHFGDLDLAGVHIFLNEFHKPIGKRAEFFIPSDADQRLAHGSRSRYDDQLARFGNMPISDPRVQFLVDMIHKHHKGYDQEGYCY